jgi:hypothetical protein
LRVTEANRVSVSVAENSNVQYPKRCYNMVVQFGGVTAYPTVQTIEICN